MGVNGAPKWLPVLRRISSTCPECESGFGEGTAPWASENPDKTVFLEMGFDQRQNATSGSAK